MTTARDLIELLQLERHASGGWFGRTFREHSYSGRPALSAIYFLLEGGDCLPWHKVDALEVWHYYDGAAMELTISQGGRRNDTMVLGKDIAAGQRPQLVVPAFHWQTAVSTGDWTLAGCTVAPGYNPDSVKVGTPNDWRVRINL